MRENTNKTRNQKRWMLLMVGVAVFQGATVRAQTPQPRQETPVMVHIHDGTLKGVFANGISSFKGIPFAAPPVGVNRWRAPQPVQPWAGVREATSYSAAPMQNRVAAMFMGANPSIQVSEDCLYLNVWTPDKTMTQKLPVMVWIHGGAFVVGMAGTPLNEGAELARHGVVVVSVAYRLGAFGFLAHPDLDRESNHGSGNYGLQDQIAGLRWVEQNIARFGGNPHNVTIFGESAGGASTALLVASPPARGLFHKVITESGYSFAFTRQNDTGPSNAASRETAQNVGRQFLQDLGGKDIAQARKLSAEAVEGVALKTKAFSFIPCVDNFVVPDHQYHRFVMGQYNDTPILIGTNSDDGGMFSAPATAATIGPTVAARFKNHAPEVLALYPHDTDAQANSAARHMVRDSVFAWPTWKWAHLQSRRSRNPAYLYYFERSQAAEGAAHASELPYVFGVGLSTPDDRAFSGQMQSYWTNFAKTGNPNGAGLAHWPAFHEPNEQALTFGNTGIAAQGVPNLQQIKTLDKAAAAG